MGKSEFGILWRTMSVAAALAMAGGFTDFANKKDVRVLRKGSTVTTSRDVSRAARTLKRAVQACEMSGVPAKVMCHIGGVADRNDRAVGRGPGIRHEDRAVVGTQQLARMVGEGPPGFGQVVGVDISDEMIRQAMAGGASGYLSKVLSGPEIVQALERIMDGESVILTGDHETSVDDAGNWPGRAVGLSPREAEVIALITQGLSNQQIADRAYLSINSVKTYIRSAYRKIGVANRTQAVLWGVQNDFRPDTKRIIDPALRLRPLPAGRAGSR